MLTTDMFTSKYYKAADLDGREMRVIMANLQQEEVGKTKEEKFVLYFKGKDKGLVLNVVNTKTIEKAYGKETDDWMDQPLILYPAVVDFQGEPKEAIRCKVPVAKPSSPLPPRPDPISTGPANPSPARRPVGGVSDNMDDEIPF